MQAYRVALRDIHAAKPDQVIYDDVTGNTYLTNGFDLGTPALYDRKNAAKKALMFNGAIQPFGKKFTTDYLTILQLSKSEINPEILKRMEDRVVFVDGFINSNEGMYFGNVFDSILEDTQDTIFELSKEAKDELMVLSLFSERYSYIMLID